MFFFFLFFVFSDHFHPFLDFDYTCEVWTQALNQSKMCLNWADFAKNFVQELCCDSLVIASWPYSSLRMRTSSHALAWDPGSTECSAAQPQATAWSILLQYVRTYMVNTAAICMYIHGQYCYNMYVYARSILLQYVSTGMVNTATICVYRHGTYSGLPGSVPRIPYSLHMLTTLKRGFVGAG